MYQNGPWTMRLHGRLFGTMNMVHGYEEIQVCKLQAGSNGNCNGNIWGTQQKWKDNLADDVALLHTSLSKTNNCNFDGLIPTHQ